MSVSPLYLEVAGRRGPLHASLCVHPFEGVLLGFFVARPSEARQGARTSIGRFVPSSTHSSSRCHHEVATATEVSRVPRVWGCPRLNPCWHERICLGLFRSAEPIRATAGRHCIGRIVPSSTHRKSLHHEVERRPGSLLMRLRVPGLISPDERHELGRRDGIVAAAAFASISA